jgi:hypothetical protein
MLQYTFETATRSFKACISPMLLLNRAKPAGCLQVSGIAAGQQALPNRCKLQRDD